MGPQTSQMPPADEQRFATGANTGETSLAETLATLRKHLWLLILGTILGLGYGFYRAETQPRLFEAASTIQVQNGSSAQYKLEQTFDYGDDSQTRMNTEVLILKSDTLLTAVATQMDLANNPDFAGPPGPTRRSINDPRVHASVIGALQNGLGVSVVPHSDMIQISFSSLSAKLSADIVNRVVTDYVHRAFEAPVQRTNDVSDFLSNQLDKLKLQVQREQQQMMDLERKMGVMGYDSTHNEVQTSLEELLSAEGAAKIARINAEAHYRMIAGMAPNTLDESIEMTPGTMPSGFLAMRTQLASLKGTYAELTSDSSRGLGPNHPQVKALQDEIAELTKQIANEQVRLQTQSKESFLASKAAEDKIEQELTAKKAEAYKQGDDLVQFTVLQREYEQDRTLYEGLEQRLETAKVESGLGATEVDTIDKALPPVNPTLHSTVTIVATSTVLFLLGSIVLAFILESLDNKLDNIQEIEGMIQMPSLAVVPKAKRSSSDLTASMTAAQRNINVLAQPKSQFAEAFRSLRTSLLLSSAGGPPKLILFTSATPSEGKTTAACNLACVLSQGGARVLLLDADLRRPNVHHRFGLTGKLGLTTLLAGTSTLQETLQRVSEISNLDILPSGPVPPFPYEMLSSDAMAALLKTLSEQYDYVVIDTPPILSVPDAAVLGPLVNAVVLVIRHRKSSKNVLRRARDLMQRVGAPVAGILLNAVDLNSPEYYGYYGYTGYSYGSMDAASWETKPDPTDDSSQNGKETR